MSYRSAGHLSTRPAPSRLRRVFAAVAAIPMAAVPMIVAVVALGGCGFHPLHAHNAGIAANSPLYADVYVPVLPGRVGLDLRNHLIDEFGLAAQSETQPYRLDINLSATEEGVAIQENDDVTRYNYRLVARWALIDVASGERRYGASARSVAAFNVVRSQFATVAAKRDVEQRATREVAEQIAARLGLYFDGQTANEADAPTARRNGADPRSG